MSRPAEPLVIGHRGASAYRPENTLPAYELAIEQGADCIEIDLHRSKDGAIVVAHDAPLARIGGEGEIGDRTLAEIRALDAGSFEGRPTRVPALDEVLDRFGARVPFNLEIKPGGRRVYEGLEAAALAALRERDLVPRTLFSSFVVAVLRELRRQEPVARLAVLVSPRVHPGCVDVEGAFALAGELGAEAINPHYLLASPELIERAHGAGLAVYVYTVDERDHMASLLDRGVDGLFTNRPDVLRRLVDERRASS